MFSAFLSSGFFLGWSLGANDASNVFGTAVGSRMIRFRTAAIYCSIFCHPRGCLQWGWSFPHPWNTWGSKRNCRGFYCCIFRRSKRLFYDSCAFASFNITGNCGSDYRLEFLFRLCHRFDGTDQNSLHLGVMSAFVWLFRNCIIPDVILFNKSISCAYV